jgi:hypothetical protein
MAGSTVIRTVGYTGTLQRLIWPLPTGQVTAYLWGGGGGAGGNDGSALGGTGSGGGFSQITFELNPGDVLDLAVGGGGGGGVGRKSSAAGGGAGPSFLSGFISYGGGDGGSAGPSGTSGGGGGGGGATVLLLNNNILAVAGGGAGGGGAGNPSRGIPFPSYGQSAPGNQGVLAATKGFPGQSKSGDGGGGGGGGGGAFSGPGGSVNPGDSGADAGSFGLGSGQTIESSFSVAAANNRSPLYLRPAAQGGTRTDSDGLPGRAGFAAFVFSIPAVYVNVSTSFVPVTNIYVRSQNAWQQANLIYLRDDNVWKPVRGVNPPIFSGVSGNFGLPGKIVVSVIDECSVGASTIQTDWNRYISANPSSQFFLLQPGGPSQGSLRQPPNFNSSGIGFGPTAVNRDNGNVSQASDWFVICGLGSLPPGTLVQYGIDNSGSMTTATVRASLNLFLSKCITAALVPQDRGMNGENWIRNFI